MSATQQTQTERQAMLPIPLAAMQAGTLAPVDLYLEGRDDQFVLYKKAEAPMTEEVRDRLLANGVTTLYLRREDEQAYRQYIERNLKAIIQDELLPRAKACQMVYDTSSHVMEDVLADPRSGANLRRACAVVEATVMAILADPEALWHMTSMASYDYYTYTHCVNVGMFLVATCRELLGISAAQQLERIGLGGVLHDIGKSQIPQEILCQPRKLTAEEFAKVKEHPLLGLALAEGQMQLPAVAGTIIRSHHEKLDGSGYPDALSGSALGSVIRLATLCDVYDALTTNRCYSKARKPFEALRLMFSEMGEQLDTDLLRSFVKFLGPMDFRKDALARAESAR